MVDIKSTSNAIWWIKNPSKRWAQNPHHQHQQQSHKIQRSITQDVVDLFRNISLHGYGKLVDSQLNLWEKLIWLAVHVTTLCTLLLVLSLTWERFVSKYVVINLHNPLYPIEMVPFPAISICSNNRISQQAAIRYANELSQKDPEHKSTDYFLKRIAYLSSVYSRYNRDYNFTEYRKFQTFLDTYDTWDNETFYDTRRNLRLLSPLCNTFILQCMLAGKEVDCFSNITFQESLTVYGSCCTFNSEDSYRERSVRNSFVNSELGLTVLLNNSRSDYFAPILNIEGYMVIIHNPDEFPDISSGSQEVFPTHNEESFLSIRARIVDTAEELRSLGTRSRKCYFDDEAPDPELLLRNSYSFANCITRCRIRSIMALCRCLPFYMPLDLVNRDDGVVYCTLEHTACLSNYNFKWQNVLTQREIIVGLEREIEEALYCPQCLPSCNDIQYQLSLMSLPIDRYQASTNINLKQQQNSNTFNVDEISVLRVHFIEEHAKYYRRTVGNTWFEAVCTVGNISSIIIGFSVVAICEFVYFLAKYIMTALKRLIRLNRHVEIVEQEKDNWDVTKLYICP